MFKNEMVIFNIIIIYVRGGAMEGKEALIALAGECLSKESKERPELIWLKDIYNRFREEYGLLRKQEADVLIYEKMYSDIPKKSTDTLKIRYWRTGRHTPSNRHQCIAFGKALDMDPMELDFLIRGYYDHSDRVFEESDTGNKEYIERRQMMDRLLDEYMKKIHPGKLLQMRISKMALENNIRHLYYTDALKYVCVHAHEARVTVHQHITSINYDSELRRSFRLMGEIPRKTVIRHLLILGMPFVNRALMDERLETLGYMPLREEHTLVGGEHLDWLLIRLLELYDRCCTGKDPEECLRWFQSACRVLDQYFEEKGKPNLRFMYFKALRD